MTGPAYPACSQRRSDALWDCEHEPRRTIRALLGPGRRSPQAPARCRVPWSSHRNPRPASCPPGLLPRGAPADRVQRFTASRKYRRGSGGGAPIPGPGTAAAQPRKAPTTTRGGARPGSGGPVSGACAPTAAAAKCSASGPPGQHPAPGPPDHTAVRALPHCAAAVRPPGAGPLHQPRPSLATKRGARDRRH